MEKKNQKTYLTRKYHPKYISIKSRHFDICIMNLRFGITGALLTSELIDARAYYLCLEQFKVIL